MINRWSAHSAFGQQCRLTCRGSNIPDAHSPISSGPSCADRISALPPAFAREQILIRLLMTFMGTELIFMLIPGTLMGVWNLFTISSEHAADSASLAWVQAHGHAQLFGWIGSFILGIGFYSIPNLRRVSTFGFRQNWLCWGFWTAGVALRCIADMYLWRWRVLLPVSYLIKLLAVTLHVEETAVQL